MEDIQGHLKDLSEIRSMMDRNTKFLSLSGLSGISAGICALLGGGLAWMQLRDYKTGAEAMWSRFNPDGTLNGRDFSSLEDLLKFLIADALLVLVAAIGLAVFFSLRMAKKKGLPIFNRTALLLTWELAVPLAAGGVFGIIQIVSGVFWWIPATLLMFYGLALLNASKYTLNEIRYLGLSQILLGLLCACFPGSGLLFLMLGFGLLHILYGILMFFRYER